MNKKIFLYAILGACFLMFLVVSPAFGATTTETFSEGFESYSDNQTLSGDWHYTDPYAYYLQSSDYNVHTGDMAMTGPDPGTTKGFMDYWRETAISSGKIDFYLTRHTNPSYGPTTIKGWNRDEEETCFTLDVHTDNLVASTSFVLNGGDETYIETIESNEWYLFEIQFDKQEGNGRARLRIAGASWTDWATTTDSCLSGVDTLQFGIYDEYKVWIDDISETVYETDASFTIYPPVSGATITDPTTEDFDISWLDYDPEEYYDFCIFFQEYETGIITGQKCLIRFDEMGTEEDIFFDDFNFDRNGKYKAIVKARKINESGRPYIATGNLMYDTDYHIFINVDGWEDYFSMPDYTEWYATTVDRFASPTDFFSGVAGFLDPFFSKIGEFGNRVEEYFDSEEAYNTGYELGIGIPLMRQYVDLVDVFFGGFPVIEVFLIILVLMLAIFIVRLILKLIPTLG